MDYYQMGYQSFLTDKTSSWWCPPILQNHNYDEEANRLWCNIMSSYDRGQWQQGRKKAILDFVWPYAESFLKELHSIEQKYNAYVDTGYGCCGGGLYITVDGIQYEINEEDFTKETQNDQQVS